MTGGNEVLDFRPGLTQASHCECSEVNIGWEIWVGQLVAPYSLEYSARTLAGYAGN